MDSTKTYVVLQRLTYKGAKYNEGQTILLTAQEVKEFGSGFIKDLSTPTRKVHNKANVFKKIK